MPRHRLVVRGGGALAALLLAAGTVGCAGSGAADGRSGSGPPLTVKLLVRDGTIRELGSECSGTGAYSFVHRSVAYQVTDGAGSKLAEGKLPAGRAVKALDEELKVPRVPTFCELTFEASVPAADRYRLAVTGGEPIDLARDTAKGAAAPAVAMLP